MRSKPMLLSKISIKVPQIVSRVAGLPQTAASNSTTALTKYNLDGGLVECEQWLA